MLFDDLGFHMGRVKSPVPLESSSHIVPGVHTITSATTDEMGVQYVVRLRGAGTTSRSRPVRVRGRLLPPKYRAVQREVGLGGIGAGSNGWGPTGDDDGATEIVSTREMHPHPAAGCCREDPGSGVRASG